MHDGLESTTEHDQSPRYRPPIGIPSERRGRWSVVVSILAHVLLILLLLGPLFAPRVPKVIRAPGSGRNGGGGAGGGYGVPERVQYMQLAPAAPTQSVAKPVPPVTHVKPPKPAVTRRRLVEKLQRVQAQVTPQVAALAPAPAPTVVAVAPGAGVETGTGAGPGTRGGTGTGIGTGRGSATGPGTGAGAGTIYPATPDFAVIPPLPVPKELEGKTVELRFTVDASGRVVMFDFDPTGDSGYDRQLRQRMGEYHFRPAHTADGTAVPSVFVTQFVL